MAHDAAQRALLGLPVLPRQGLHQDLQVVHHGSLHLLGARHEANAGHERVNCVAGGGVEVHGRFPLAVHHAVEQREQLHFVALPHAIEQLFRLHVAERGGHAARQFLVVHLQRVVGHAVAALGGVVGHGESQRALAVAAVGGDDGECAGAEHGVAVHAGETRGREGLLLPQLRHLLAELPHGLRQGHHVGERGLVYAPQPLQALPHDGGQFLVHPQCPSLQLPTQARQPAARGQLRQAAGFHVQVQAGAAQGQLPQRGEVHVIVAHLPQGSPHVGQVHLLSPLLALADGQESGAGMLAGEAVGREVVRVSVVSLAVEHGADYCLLALLVGEEGFLLGDVVLQAGSFRSCSHNCLYFFVIYRFFSYLRDEIIFSCRPLKGLLCVFRFGAARLSRDKKAAFFMISALLSYETAGRFFRFFPFTFGRSG